MGKKLTKHHLVAKERGGDNSPSNFVRIPEDMHRAYHILFDTMTLEEATSFLESLKDVGISPVLACSVLWMPDTPKGMNGSRRMYLVFSCFTSMIVKITKAYQTLFGDMALDEAISFLKTWRTGNHKVIKSPDKLS